MVAHVDESGEVGSWTCHCSPSRLSWLDGPRASCSIHTGGTYLERQGCMLEPVVRCNARVSMLAALVQLDACRLRLGSVLRSQRSTQHAEQARLGRRGGTAVMKDLVGGTQQRHVQERGARRLAPSLGGQHGRRPRARVASTPGTVLACSRAHCAASRAQTARQQIGHGRLAARAWRGLALGSYRCARLPKS